MAENKKPPSKLAPANPIEVLTGMNVFYELENGNTQKALS